MRLKLLVIQIFEYFEKSHNSIILSTHPDRNCIYKESEIVVESGFDSSQIVKEQMIFYKETSYPENYGLHATTLFLRSHRDGKLNLAMSGWHQQVCAI